MTKILKCIMFTRLYDKFPHIKIKEISKSGHPPKLLIWCESPVYREGSEEEFVSLFDIRIDPANKQDREEPYTQETLEKALIEFPIKYQEQVDRQK